MPVRIRQKVNISIPGVKSGVMILSDELGKAGPIIGRHLQAKVREKQRLDTGEERRNTLWRSRVRGTNLLVSTYNTKVQALVDETGARWRGTMPPSHPGSKLFSWVSRKGLAPKIGPAARRNIRAFAREDARRAGAGRAGQNRAANEAVEAALGGRDKEVARVAFAVARSIARRGLPRPGDPLRKPFEATRKEERPAIVRMVRAAVSNAATRINKATRRL